MKKLKEKVILMRKNGNSYSQIQKKLLVPKSTLSLWLKKLDISLEVKNKINQRGRTKSIEALVKRNKEQTVKAKFRAKELRNKYSKDISSLQKNDIFFLGLGLYLGEGYKRGAEGSKWKCVDIANSDPDIIILMMRFFRECCDVKEKDFRFYLSLHTRENESNVVDFWVVKTGSNKSNFIKTSFVQSKSSKYSYPKRLTHGTLHIRIYNTDLFHQIIGWIDGIRKML